MGMKTHKVKADVIILGYNLPGIVAAHKLKKKFGDSMDIVVLDFSARRPGADSKCNVVFQGLAEEPGDDEEDLEESSVAENITKLFLSKYAGEFAIPIPEYIIAPTQVRKPLSKVFENLNGDSVQTDSDYYEFQYLNFVEKFELNQYHSLLDNNMKDLFYTNKINLVSARNTLRYYDQTTMEQHLCAALLFSNSREIMRTTVRLVCGVPADTVSVLFYLHQCFRTGGSRNHIDGDNTRFREKILGFCRKRLAHKLQQSISDITFRIKPIKKISACPNDKVILETMKGGTTYVCKLLAMALRPDELHNIRVDEDLMSQEYLKISRGMIAGKTKKFLIKYNTNFWGSQGYSGDILSTRGPIVWAMERPSFSSTGSSQKYAALIGYLKVQDDGVQDSQEAVVEQLKKLFGEEASSPVMYRETDVADMYIPRCGDYVALRRLAESGSKPEGHTIPMEWGTLDVFADGDIVAAIEAGHATYLHLLRSLRPQALTFEDVSALEWPTALSGGPMSGWLVKVNYINSMKWTVYLTVAYITARLYFSYTRK